MTRMADAVKKYRRGHQGPIVDPSVKDLMSKLNPLNYEKGAWVLHMLRRRLGDEAFFRGINRYYKMYAQGTALTVDFQSVMESESGVPLEDFFRQWIYQPGWPDLRINWHWNAAEHRAELRVVQAQKTGLFDLPIEAAFHCGNETQTRDFRISLQKQDIGIPLPCKPTAVEVDPGGWVLKDLVLAESK